MILLIPTVKDELTNVGGIRATKVAQSISDITNA